MCKEAKEEYLEECCKEIEKPEKKDVQMMHEKSQTGYTQEEEKSGRKDEDGSKSSLKTKMAQFWWMRSQSREGGPITSKVSMLMMEGKKNQG